VSKTFDATLNTLIDAHAADWADFLAARVGLPTGPSEPLDTDLSATLQADRLFRVNGPVPAVLHLELESSGRLGIPGELLRYNVAVHGVTGLPVYSVLLLLRPKATATDLSGTHELPGTDGRPYLSFRYTVVRVWQEGVDDLLRAGPGLAPLSLLTNEAANDLDAAFDRLRERLRQPDVASNVAEDLLGSTYVLGGLRYDDARLANLYRRLSMILEDSTTYQAILRKGMQEMVLRLAAKRFGPPEAGVAETVRGVTDRERLERMAERVLDATGWDDVLATR
jgi:hypothetical protein